MKALNHVSFMIGRYDPISADDQFTFASVMNMLLLDALIYGALTLYLDAVFPGEHGVAKPWNFLLAPLLNLVGGGGNDGRTTHGMSSMASMDGQGESGGLFETDPDGLETGIEMQG